MNTKVWRSALAAVMLTGAVAVLPATGAHADSTLCYATGPVWQHETVDWGNDSYTGLRGLGNAAVTWGGQVHNFYSTGWANVLMHSWKTGSGAWQLETLDGLNDGPRGELQGHIASYGISAVVWYGQLHVFYANRERGDLRHAIYNGSWHFETLDGDFALSGRVAEDVGYYTTTAIHNNELHVFYLSGTTRMLRHAWYNPVDGWRYQPLAAQVTIDWISAAVRGGELHVFYSNGSNVFDEWWDPWARMWKSMWVDAGTAPRAAVMYAGQVHVFYPNAIADLRHSWYDGVWHRETLDGSGGPAMRVNAKLYEPTAIVVGNNLRVFYWDATNWDLRQAFWDTNTWQFLIIDGGSNCTSGTTLPVGGFNSPTVYNNTLYVFHYAFEVGFPIRGGNLRVAHVALS